MVVTKGFQGFNKNDKKKGNTTLYDTFNTKQGGQGIMLEPIITHQMNFLHQEIIVASMIVDHEHGLCT